LGDADHAHLTLLNEILFGGRASRLHRALVIDQEVVSDLRGWVATFRDPGLYEMHFTARPGKTAADIETILTREIERARSEGVSDDELARAKARLELATLQSMDTMSGKAEQIGFYETVLGDASASFRRLEDYRRTQAGDVLRAARRYIVDRARTVIHVLAEERAGDRQNGAAEAAE
ncbi:MAG TPA: insulinase family protein, partial [Polyangiaceae bacterium]|nr:insulinase family protein [Polyangiaceae bacterium]